MKWNFKIISTAGKLLYPSLLWKIPDSPGTIYLTFDDGPIPEVTPWVLSLLKDFNAKATFFCIGENIRKNPTVFIQVLSEGHSIGNHTYNHLKGWKTSTKEYVKNVLLAEEIIRKVQISGFGKQPDPATYNRKKLFRPPYGKITPSQLKKVQRLDYKIVMWDVISMDFDNTFSAKECMKNVTKYSKDGSIIVFHDSIKAFTNLKEVLPEVLEYYGNKGFEFKAL